MFGLKAFVVGPISVTVQETGKGPSWFLRSAFQPKIRGVAVAAGWWIACPRDDIMTFTGNQRLSRPSMIAERLDNGIRTVAVVQSDLTLVGRIVESTVVSGWSLAPRMCDFANKP